MTGPDPLPHPIEASIDGLYQLWHDQPELEYDDGDGNVVRLAVFNPLPLTDVEDRRILLVGTGAQYALGTTARQTYDLGGGQLSVVDVLCELQVWSGAENPREARALAFGQLGALEQLLRRDRTLGGRVSWARVTATTYEPSQTETGSGAVLEVTVRTDAHRDHEE